MTHHAKLNWIMVVTIAVLMVFLYFRPQAQDAAGYAISDHPAEAVQYLRIVRHQQEIALERSAGYWWMTQPVRILADDQKVQAMLQILQARSEQQLPADDLKRFGLAEPNVKLYLNDQYIGFGGFTPITHQQYVATGNHVYTVSPRYGLALPAMAADLMDLRLLPPDAVPVQLVLPQWTVAFQHDRWNITSPPNQTMDDAMPERWVHQWRIARAIEVTLDDPRTGGFVKNGEIKIALQDGLTIEFEILQNGLSMVLWQPDKGIGYQLPAETAQQLLDPRALQPQSSISDH